MKSLEKLKGFVAIVKSGVTGAFVSTGTTIFLVLFISGDLASLPHLGHIFEHWTKSWTIEGIYKSFVAVFCSGFLFGILLARRWPSLMKKMFPPAIIFGGLLALGALAFYICGMNVVIPREIKLVDCTNGTMNVQLNVPKGRNYYLALAIKGMRQMPDGSLISPYIFSGKIRITSGTSSIADFPISSKFSLPDTQGLVITGVFQNTNLPSLSRFIDAQKNYDIQITLDPPPPPSTSLWLHWLQAKKDMGK